MRKAKTSPRQRKTKDPCPQCWLHKTRCICEFIPRFDLKTKLSLVIHRKELEHSTNTGRLALLSLKNSEMHVRGEENTRLDLRTLLTPHYRTYLLYPTPEAVELTDELIAADSRPIQLIVPDGSWRQASKVHYRHHELKEVERIIIKPQTTSALVMRKESKEHAMSTLEAIALALGVLEGAEVQAGLMKLYQAKLDQTLKGRASFLPSSAALV